jgi:TnpA family transposase
MAVKSKRLTILSENEITAIYARPLFNHDEQNLYFSLNVKEQAFIDNLQSVISKTHLILLMGYFKAKQLVFNFTYEEVINDVEYITKKYFPSHKKIKLPSSSTVRDNKRKLLAFFKFIHCKAESRDIIQHRLEQLVKIHKDPYNIFRSIIDFCEEKNILLPGYTTLQSSISKAISSEQKRLEKLIMEYLSKDEKKLLMKLLQTTSECNISKLTIEPKDFSFSEMAKEIKKKISYENVFHAASKIVPKLGISRENIARYSSMVNYYTIDKLRRLKKPVFYLYCISHLFYKNLRINDNLTAAFIYQVDQIHKKAKNLAKDMISTSKIDSNIFLPEIAKILDMFGNNRISNNTPFGEIREKAFNIIPTDKMKLLSTYISKAKFDENKFYWDAINELASKFKKNLRPLLSNLDFENVFPDDSLLHAVSLIKSTILERGSLHNIDANLFPIDIISSKDKKHIKAKTIFKKGVKKASIHPDKYEFYVYHLIRKGLDSGELFVKQSINYKSFESGLIEEKTWAKDKEKILQSLGYSKLNIPIKCLLKELENTLENKYHIVNKRINSKENTCLKFHSTSRGVTWTLPYKKQDNKNHYTLYDKLPQTGIYDLAMFVNSHCNFMDKFEHIKSTHISIIQNKQFVIPAIIANGTCLGTYRMSEISDVNYRSLQLADKNHLRPDTLTEACNTISSALSKLPMFKYYDIESEVHAATDGQKYESIRKTIKTRYSTKYFGNNKGVVAMTLSANHIPINAKIISANEYEGNYVFDLIHNNSSGINPTICSTDTAGTNQLNFALLFFIQKEFAPRYKNITSKTDKIYGFNDTSKYKDYIIQPSNKIDTKLIIEEWDNVLRIIASLLKKDTEQSILVKQLSSHHRKNKTKRALWEFDKILMSIYLLSYIDDKNMRKNIQKSLNRVESYHQMRKAIAIVNSKRFRGTSDQEIENWSECSRFLAHCVLYYNTYLLSKLLNKYKDLKQQDMIDIIKDVSPTAWQHINFFGKFEFKKEVGEINLDDVVLSIEVKDSDQIH